LATFWSGYGIAISGTYAYIADGDNGLSIVNVSDPAHPALAGSCDTPGTAQDVAVSGSFAYMADGDGGLRVINVADSAHPALVSSYVVSNTAYSVVVSGTYAYMAYGYSGLHIVNVSDPAHPAPVGSVPDPQYGYATDVALDGSRAYVTDYFGLLIAETANHAQPTWISADYLPGDAEGVAFSSPYVYVADGDGGLFIMRQRHKVYLPLVVRY